MLTVSSAFRQELGIPLALSQDWQVALLGVANGKIRDSPRHRDPCLKIRDRDLKALTKSEPETSLCENLSRFPKLFAAKHDNELHDIQ